MALVNAGFNGTVEEADFAHMFAIGGADGVESSAAWAVTQGTGRQVSVAANAGRAFARGVVSRDNSGPVLANLGTPVNGQWYLIVRRINWLTNTVTVVALPSTTTSTTVPTAPPATALPIGGQEVTAGVLYDQPLAWAWVRSTDTTVLIVDLRTMPAGERLARRQLESYSWANEAARTAQTGMAEGAVGYQRDTDVEYIFDGSSWVPQDTGWITASLGGGLNHEAGNPLQYRRRNGVVYFRGRLTSNGGSSGAVVFTLPAGFRPDGSAGAINIFYADSNGPTRINIPTNTGAVTLLATPSAGNFTIPFTFIAAV